MTSILIVSDELTLDNSYNAHQKSVPIRFFFDTGHCGFCSLAAEFGQLQIYIRSHIIKTQPKDKRQIFSSHNIGSNCAILADVGYQLSDTYAEFLLHGILSNHYHVKAGEQNTTIFVPPSVHRSTKLCIIYH